MKPALTKDFLWFLTDKKRNSRKIAHLLGCFNKSQSSAVLECCSEFGLGDDGKFYRTYFCHSIFCPTCAWKESREQFMIVRELCRRMSKYFGFLFCTLTIKNCRGEDLKEYCSRLTKAAARFTGSTGGSHFKAFRGGFRSLEITYDEKTDTYHPHMHLLIAVPRVYFNRKKNKNLWIDRDTAFDWYKHCIGEEFLDPSQEHQTSDGLVSVGGFDFRCVYQKRHEGEALSSVMEYADACAEVAKYTLKDIPLLKLLDNDPDRAYNVFGYIYHALWRRQKTAFFGIMQEYKKDLDEEDLNFHFIQLDEGVPPTSVALFEYTELGTYYYRSSVRISRNTESLLPLNVEYYDRKLSDQLGILPPSVEFAYYGAPFYFKSS